MDTRHTVITAIDPLLDILHSRAIVAISAPLFTDEESFIGYYSAASENSTCAVMPVRDAHTLAETLYQPKTSVLRVHGLKRIWEALDIGTRDVNPDLISDTELMAYLLHPDARDKGLTLSALCAEYLGEEYPHRILDIRDQGYPAAFAAALAYDAELIGNLAERLAFVMTDDLRRLYRQIELPLMLILDEMRRVGIGVDGGKCVKERARAQAELVALADEITQGKTVNLASEEQVFQFLIEQGVRFASPWLYSTRKVSIQALEEVAHLYPVVRKVLEWRDLAQDMGFLNLAAGKTRVHPI